MEMLQSLGATNQGEWRTVQPATGRVRSTTWQTASHSHEYLLLPKKEVHVYVKSNPVKPKLLYNFMLTGERTQFSYSSNFTVLEPEYYLNVQFCESLLLAERPEVYFHSRRGLLFSATLTLPGPKILAVLFLE